MASAKKLPSGNWRVLLYVGTDAAGKKKYESFTASTKSEAEYLAAEYNLKNPSEKRAHITLGTAFDSYIDSKSEVISPSTLREYKTTRKNHFQDLMDTPISKIKNKDIQIEINKIAASHAPKTVRNIHGLLSAVLKMFRPDFVLTTTLPQKTKKEIFIPEKSTVKRLTKYAEGTGIEIPLLLAATAGLRASEINGLTYECISRERNEITIKQASVRGENGNVLKQPKSYSGYRTIPCSKYVIDKLGEGAPEQFVVGLTSEMIKNRWNRFLQSHNEKHFNFHALRHYYCSQAILLGIPKKYIAELMGHASENMIDQVYAHTFKDEKQQFANLVVSATNTLFED